MMLTQEQRDNLAHNLVMFMTVHSLSTVELARICEVTPAWMEGIEFALCDASEDTLAIMADEFSMKPHELLDNRWEAVLNAWTFLSGGDA